MKKIITMTLVSLFAVSAIAAPPAKKGATTPAQMKQNVEKQTVQGMDNTNRGGTFARSYGMAGCGLGSQIMGAKDGQIFAATSNASFGTQVFGITFGTSNCVGSETSAKADRMDRYIVANKVQLADDIARGQGETINGLSQIMNCGGSANLGSKLQSRFSTIFASHDMVANEITDRIITVVGQDSELSSSCSVTVSSL